MMTTSEVEDCNDKMLNMWLGVWYDDFSNETFVKPCYLGMNKIRTSYGLSPLVATDLVGFLHDFVNLYVEFEKRGGYSLHPFWDSNCWHVFHKKAGYFGDEHNRASSDRILRNPDFEDSITFMKTVLDKMQSTGQLLPNPRIGNDSYVKACYLEMNKVRASYGLPQVVATDAGEFVRHWIHGYIEVGKKSGGQLTEDIYPMQCWYNVMNSKAKNFLSFAETCPGSECIIAILDMWPSDRKMYES